MQLALMLLLLDQHGQSQQLYGKTPPWLIHIRRRTDNRLLAVGQARALQAGSMEPVPGSTGAYHGSDEAWIQAVRTTIEPTWDTLQGHRYL